MKGCDQSTKGSFRYFKFLTVRATFTSLLTTNFSFALKNFANYSVLHKQLQQIQIIFKLNVLSVSLTTPTNPTVDFRCVSRDASKETENHFLSSGRETFLSEFSLFAKENMSWALSLVRVEERAEENAKSTCLNVYFNLILIFIINFNVELCKRFFFL